jgi:LacI family fructose operon transcriptional repressor
MARAAVRRKSTIYDIATATDSSPATVSLVLNGSWARYRIKKETALRILESARLLSYNVNLKARGLRLSRSGLAGMILPHYRNRFFADLAETFEAEARGRSLCPIVVSTQRDQEVEAQVTQTLLAQQVEVLFIAGVHEPDPLNRLCAAAGVPCVNLDLPGPGAPSVVTDNKGGARRLTEALIEKVKARGERRTDFLYLGGVAGEYATDNRAAGFVEALNARGIETSEAMLVRCGYAPASACDALTRYLATRRELPSGLFINSITAFEGFVRFTAALPRQTLETTVVGCFDWDPFAAHLPFDVTMLRQDVETMVAEAFGALDADKQQACPFTIVSPILMPARAEPPLDAAPPLVA